MQGSDLASCLLPVAELTRSDVEFIASLPACGLLNAAERVDGTAELALQGAGVVLGVLGGLVAGVVQDVVGAVAVVVVDGGQAVRVRPCLLPSRSNFKCIPPLRSCASIQGILKFLRSFWPGPACRASCWPYPRA